MLSNEFLCIYSVSQQMLFTFQLVKVQHLIYTEEDINV